MFTPCTQAGGEAAGTAVVQDASLHAQCDALRTLSYVRGSGLLN